MSEQEKTKLVVHDDGPMAAFLDTALFEQIQRAGQMLAASTCIPESYQGKPADCSVAIALAKQLKVNVVQLMNKSYVIHGKPGLEAQFKIALANNSRVFDGPIDWKVEGEGKTRSWTAFAKLGGSDRIVDFTVDWSMVEAEGWDKPRVNKKTGFSQTSKWTTMPEKMGRLRAASYLIDLFAPQVVLGMHTTDELLDAEHEITGERVDEKPKIRQPRAKQLPETEYVLPTKQAISDLQNMAVHFIEEEKINPDTGEITMPVDEPPKKELTEAELKPITKGLCSVIKTKMEGNGLTIDDFIAQFGKGIEALNMAEADLAIDFINAHNNK